MHPTLRAGAVAAFFVVVTAESAAFAREAVHVRPGVKMFGELGGLSSATVLVDGVEGMTFSATCKAFRGTKLAVTLSMTTPDGSPADLSKSLRISRGGASASLKNYAFEVTGPYLLTVRSTSAAAGGFDLVTTGTLPRKTSGSTPTPSGGASISFPAAPGDKVTCVVKPARGAKAKPTILRYVDADGGAADVDATRTKKPIEVRAAGRSRFDVQSAAPAGFSYVLTFVRAKAPRASIDFADAAAVGTLSGTIVVEGLNDADATSASVPTKSARRTTAPDLAPGEIVMSLPDARTADDVVAAAEASLPDTRCSVEAALTDRGPYLVRVEHLRNKVDRRAKTATRVLAKSAAAAGRVDWCEPNYVAQADVVPNDPLWTLQYDMKEIRCPDAWEITRGTPSVVVAVVDTGMTGHPDLAGAWLPGYDFVSDPTSAMDGDGWDADPSDAAFVSHGTHVAGTIGARTDNGIGITGIAPLCGILPVRVLGKGGLGTYFDIAAGMRWAVGLSVAGAPANPNPARVVNMSLGGPVDSQLLRDAVAAVIGQTDAVLVVSAGNNGNSVPNYPASYSGVVSVSAVDSNLRLTSYSSWGPWVTLAAPGGDQSRGLHGILSCFVDATTHLSQYREMDGTSMAAPHVAGVAALLLSQDATLTRNQITSAMYSTALDLGATGRDLYYGYGVVDARAALDSLVGPGALPALFAGPTQLTFSDSQGRLFVLVGARGDAKVTVTDVLVTTDDGAPWLTASTPATTLPALVTVDVDPNLPYGGYTGHVYVDTSIGRQDVPVTVYRAAPPGVSAVTIEARDEGGGLVGRTTTGPVLDWKWTIPGVTLGRRTITAFADLDGSIAADRVDEYVGAWPIPLSPATVEVATETISITTDSRCVSCATTARSKASGSGAADCAARSPSTRWTKSRART